MTAEPKPGDRIRVDASHEGILVAPFVLEGDDGARVAFGRGHGTVTVTILAPAERWQAGSLVRSADNPADRGLWFYAPREDGDLFPWIVLYIDDDGSTSMVGDRVSRAELPENLTLIVCDGRIVLPEVTDEDVEMAWGGCRGGLRSAIDTVDKHRGVIRP